MKTKSKCSDSKTLIEVWSLKGKAYDEVKNLSIREALRKRLIDSINTTKKYAFPLSLRKSITSSY